MPFIKPDSFAVRGSGVHPTFFLNCIRQIVYSDAKTLIYRFIEVALQTEDYANKK